jgi:hypothetical protein
MMMTDVIRAGIGRDNAEMVAELLSSVAIWPFTERLGMTAAEVESLVAAAQSEMQDSSLRLYIPV